MKKEYIALIYSMINNLFISMLKIFGGIFSGSNSLFSDGLHTFSDFITDIFAFIGSKISRKRPNKLHPFGYGRVEYVTSLFIGIVIFCLGVFIIINAFLGEHSTPSTLAIIIIVVAVLLKAISVFYLMNTGKKIKSQTLITSGRESLTDLCSSALVIVIIILSKFASKFSILKYSDLIGSVFIGILILVMAYGILKENILSLIGEVSDDKEILKRVEMAVESIDGVELVDTKLIKYGSYYKANIEVELDPNITIMKLARLEKRIFKKLKKEKVGIKYLTMEVEPDKD